MLCAGVETSTWRCRVLQPKVSRYVLEWELNRKQEATDILKTGKRVYKTDLERHEKSGTPLDFAATCVGLFVQLWVLTDFRVQAHS
jgi:hypothetical protein